MKTQIIVKLIRLFLGSVLMFFSLTHIANAQGSSPVNVKGTWKLKNQNLFANTTNHQDVNGKQGIKVDQLNAYGQVVGTPSYFYRITPNQPNLYTEEKTGRKVTYTSDSTLSLTEAPNSAYYHRYNGGFQNPPNPNTPSVGQGLVNDIDFDNWSFEKGLNGWSKVVSAFSNQPTYGDNVLTDRVLTSMDYAKGGIGGNYWKEMAYPIGHKGSYWIGTYENRPTANATVGKTQGNPPVGSLFSSEFKITKKSCDFLLGGSAGNVNVSVELQTKTADGKWTTSLKVSPAINTDQMYRNVFDLKPFAGKTARIAIIDNATNGYINVDDFRFFDDAQEYIRIGNKLLDKDVPVWGFADTHAHPTSQEGFGGKTLIGNPGDPLEITYSSADCVLRHLPNLFVGIADPHIYGLGYPNFAGFPRFNSKTHQQQHVEFLKRAKEGGLRLYCALAVTNMYLPSRAIGPANDGKPLDDESVMYRELDLLKKIAATQKSWMEIANTPQDARRIIKEDKLAIVLGIEADNLGNFKSPTYLWKDVARDRPMVALTESNADTKLDAKLSEYYNYGIRQITPIHYISGVFGGAAVFRGEPALVQFEFNGKVNVKGGVYRKVGYSLYEDFAVGASFVGSGLIYATYVALIQKKNEEAEISMVNADGMTSIGEKLVKKMMQRGFLIDSEHMSYESKDDLFNMAKANNNYPIMSSHTDPHGLSFNWKGTPRRFSGSNEDKFKYFGTTTIRNVAQEGQLLNEHYQRIKELGGTVGLFLLPYTKLAYTGKWGSIPNDCAGSSKTWAQMYLHSLDQLDGKGVAFSSDRGMVDFIAPRFGVNAAYSMKEENDLVLKIRVRNQQRAVQKNGVRYDRASKSYFPQLFEFGGDAVPVWEEDAWKALAAWEAGANPFVNPDQISQSSEVGHGGRILNFTKGLFASNQSKLSKWYIASGDLAWEQSAMFCLKNNITPDNLTIHDAGGIRETKNYYDKLKPIWDLWQAKNGNNPQLRRYRTGNRDWDYNLDGIAHYGLIPDFMQDLRNIGLTPTQLTPLFRSAEDYIQMWEKADKIRGSVK